MIGIALLATTGLSCGSSSSNNGNITNGNSAGNSADSLNTGTTTGGVSTGPPGVLPSTLLTNVPLPTGTWGGDLNTDTGGSPAMLTVSSTGTQLTLSCGRTAEFSQPIVLDATGSFKSQGTGNMSFKATAPASTITLSGGVGIETVNGQSRTLMIVSIDDPDSYAGSGPYFFILGHAALPYTGTCP